MEAGLILPEGSEGRVYSNSSSLACEWPSSSYASSHHVPSVFVCVQIFPFRRTRVIRFGLTLMTHLKLITFVKTLCPNTFTFWGTGIRAQTYTFGERHNSAHHAKNQLFLLSKFFTGCCKSLINFQSSENVDPDNFCQFLHYLYEEDNF